MGFNIFVNNPGSTSTKVAWFFGNEVKLLEVIRHDPEEIASYPSAASQYQFRYESVLKVAKDKNIDLSIMDAFVGRGGLLSPLKGGTYLVTQNMLDDLKNSRYGDHACNLGALIASKLAEDYGKKAYVVNPVVVDEMMDIARYTGLSQIKRRSAFHALNQKAAALRAAEEIGIKYDEARFIIAHLGGGISVGIHDMGKVIDVNDAISEGPFSPERAGTIPSEPLVEMCFSGDYTKEQIKKMLVGKGGIYSYTGTTNMKKVEEMASVEKRIDELLSAMSYKISKEICSLLAATCGKIDRIIITGGLAHSKRIVDDIIKRVSFIAPVIVYPGEDEMEALAKGSIRVLEGKEQVLYYGGAD